MNTNNDTNNLNNINRQSNVQLNESNKNINNQSNEQKVTKSHPLNTDKLFNYNEITGINKVVLGKQKIESIALNCLINNNNTSVINVLLVNKA